jgi:putative endonuclease
MNSAGSDAEALAARHLARQGLQVIERNYRCRGGEIDLVCRDGATLVFVEVRLRFSRSFGGAAASITATKQEKLLTTARQYLAQLGRDVPCRFDAVLIDGAGHIEWLRDAFGE